MLTTIDNPYNPYTQYDEWFALDRQLGYNTCEFLARICENISYQLDQDEQEEIVHDAMDRIIAMDPFEIYTKAYPPEGYKPSEPELLDPDDFENLYPVD